LTKADRHEGDVFAEAERQLLEARKQREKMQQLSEAAEKQANSANELIESLEKAVEKTEALSTGKAI
jgi:non-homologous end joining protein Ku